MNYREYGLRCDSFDCDCCQKIGYSCNEEYYILTNQKRGTIYKILCENCKECFLKTKCNNCFFQHKY